MENSPETMKALEEQLVALCDYYGRTRGDITRPFVLLYFNALKAFTFDQVSTAISHHMQDPESGQFFPKIADILKYIKGRAPRPSEVIAMARNPVTPFGVLARIHIGSWDLGMQDHNYLIDRANEVLHHWDEWRDRAICGEYSDHELSMMYKLEVNPGREFAPGVVAIDGPNRAKLAGRCRELIQSDRHAFLLDKPDEYDESDKGIHPRTAEIVKGVLGSLA